MQKQGHVDPRLTFVVAAYNAAPNITRTLDSLEAQDTQDQFEIVVVDDGSTDDTADLARGHPSAPTVVVVPENRGPSAARNTGVAAASGRYLSFVDADDELDPTWVNEMMAASEPAEPAAVSCGGLLMESHSGVEVDLFPEIMSPAFFGMRGRFIGGTYMVRSDVFAQVGGFAEEIRYGEHTELALKITRYCHESGEGIVTVPKILARLHLDRGPSKSNRYRKHRIDGSRATLENHAAQLERDPQMAASYLAVAGVALIQEGRRPEARRALLKAARLGKSPRDFARLAAVLMPGVSRMVWMRQSRAPVGDGLP